MQETGTQQCTRAMDLRGRFECGPKHKGYHFDQATGCHSNNRHATPIETSLCVVQTSSEVRKLEILKNSLRMRRRKRQQGLPGCVGW